MARPIDEKIVKMTLDNAKFKTNVKDTLGSIKSINDTVGSTKNMDLSAISKSISTIERRFSALGVIAATVLSSITKSAINMGKGMYKAVVDPIVEGGKKRALNIEQAKFQFEGLGMDVEKTMESALEAVKGTAYGLDEAAVVASQFGATGMKAGDEMTEALRGISGVAAMTGSSYSDIGNIFTTVAGNGRLMGNDLLRLGARGVNAAAVLGKAMNKTESEIRAMVTKGQISFEDFAKAMSDAFGEHATKANETYTGSLSNLNAALGRIGAEIYTKRFENLRDIFNATTPKVDDLADAIKPLISAFNELSDQSTKKLISAIEKIDFKKFEKLGGTKNLLESFWNVVGFGKTVLTSMGEGFKRAFPQSFMTTVIGITEGIKNLTANLKLSDATAEKLSIIFQGVFSIFSAVGTIAMELAKAIFGIIPAGTGDSVLDFAVLIAELAIAFNESVKEGNILTKSIQGLGKILGWIGKTVKTPLEAIISFAVGIKENIGPVLDWLKEKLTPVGEWFKEAFSGFGMEELLGGGVLLGIITLLKKLDGFFEDAKSNIDGITGAVTGVFKELGGALKSFQEQVKYNNLMKIAVAIGLLAVSLKLLEGMSVGSIAKGLTALALSMGVLAGGMMIIEGISFTGGLRASTTIIALATAVLIMSGALKKISDLSIGEIIKGVAGLTGVILALVVGISALSSIDGKMQVGALRLVGLATSIVILASAVEKMSSINTGSLLKSVTALGVIFLELGIFLRIADGVKLGPSTALGLIGTAAAIQLIVKAIDSISNINTPNLIKGLVTIGAILTEVALFGTLAGGPHIIAAGTGLVIVAAGINALIGPVTKLGKMSWTELAKGLGGMAVALTAVGVAGVAASGSIAGAVGIGMMALALNTLMPPILIFSKMSWGSMIKGIAGIALSMTTLGLASAALAPTIPPMLGFSAALLALGAAVALAGGGIGLFGVGLSALAGLTATSVAAIISALGMLIKGLGTLVTDIVRLVVDISSALLDGLMDLVPKIGQVVTTIVNALIDGLIDFLNNRYPALASAFANTIIMILQLLASHSKDFVTAGYDIVIGLMKGVQEKAPELMNVGMETITALILGMAEALSKNREPMVSAMVRLMGEVILVVVEAGVQMVDALFGWIPGVQQATAAIGDTAEDYIRKHFGAYDAGVDGGEEFASGISSTSVVVRQAGEGIAKSGKEGAESQDLTISGSKYASTFNTGIESQSGNSEKSGTTIAKSAKKGSESQDLTPSGSKYATTFNTGINSQSRNSESSGKGLADSGKRGASSTDLYSTGSTFGRSFGTGTGSNSTYVRNMGVSLGNSGVSGASGASLYNTGSNFGRSFGLGISVSKRFVVEKAKSVAMSAATTVAKHLAIRSPSRVLVKFGEFFSEGFGIGIQRMGKYAIGKAKDMAVNTTNALKNTIENNKPEEEIKFKIIVDDEDWDDFDPSSGGSLTQRLVTRELTNDTMKVSRQNREKLDSNDIPKDDRDFKELLSVSKEQNRLLTKILDKDHVTVIDKNAMKDTVDELNALEDILSF